MASLVRRPLLLWLLYVLVLLGLALTAKALWPALTSGAAGLSGLQVALQAVLTLLPLPVAAYLGWRRVGFVRPNHLAIALFPAATVAVGYFGGWRDQPWTTTALAVVLVCLVALGEETAFRGVLLTLLRERHGVAAAVVISSALFGLTHLVNLALGAPLPGVLLQVLFAGLGSAGFAALRLRTGSLWPPIVLHAVYDLTFRVVDLQPGTALSNTVYMLHGVGWAAFAVIVLRGTSRRAPVAQPPATAVAR
jgi:membrane protease YdiL (CAAX protease family)